MINRYDDKLRINNDAIISLSPANEVFRIITALEIKKYYSEGKRILEIGSGEGHSALTILERTGAPMDLLDISPEMIEESRKNLADYSKNLTFICSDIISYLEKCEPYDIMTASWTLHNFKWPEKKVVFEKMHEKLAPGGSMIIMDKIYPDKDREELLNLQLKRYRYLPSDVEAEIVAHEMQDVSDEYRMDEASFLALLKEIGFKNIEVVDRIERDIVLAAHK